MPSNGFYTSGGTELVNGFVRLLRKTDDGWDREIFFAETTWVSTYLADDHDGLGDDVSVSGDTAFGFADDYILKWEWNETAQQWGSSTKLTNRDDYYCIQADGDMVAYGTDSSRVTVVSPSGELQLPYRCDPSAIWLDGGTLVARRSSTSSGLRWYDVDGRVTTEEYLVATKAGGEIAVSITGEFLPSLEIYDASGELVASGENGCATYIAASAGIYTVKVSSDTTDWPSYDVSILAVASDWSDLGTVDDLEVLDALETSPTGQFLLEATRRGYLTVLAHETTASAEASLVLMAADGTVLAQASAASADSSTLWQYEWRLDYEVTAGETYLLAVTGDLDLRLCNLVAQSGTTVDVYDTAGTDAYRFAVTDTFDVTANGVKYTFDDATEFNFTSTAGDDTVEMVDSDGDDTLTVSPTEMAMTGTTGGGVTYSVSAEGFRYSHAYARVGGNDTAYFVGSEQKERMKAYEGLVKLMGGQYYARAKFFESVEVAMGDDGEDTAVVVGSDGADVLWAMKEALKVSHNVSLAEGEGPDFDGMSYDVTVTGCEWIVARGSGSDDWVQLHDSAVNDVFIAKPHKLQMMNAPRTEDDVARGEEYTITVRGYTNVSAVADQGGDNDVAKLYDSSESGTDVWSADYVDGKTWSAMTSPSRLLYEVLAFEQVGGYGFNGGLGEDHGTNQRDHGDDVDFVFEYGYWEDASTTSRPLEGSWWNGRESL